MYRGPEARPPPYLATGVCGGDEDRATAIGVSATAPDELLTSSRISHSLWRSCLSLRGETKWGKDSPDRDAPGGELMRPSHQPLVPISRRQFEPPGIRPMRPT